MVKGNQRTGRIKYRNWTSIVYTCKEGRVGVVHVIITFIHSLYPTSYFPSPTCPRARWRWNCRYSQRRKLSSSLVARPEMNPT